MYCIFAFDDNGMLIFAERGVNNSGLYPRTKIVDEEIYEQYRGSVAQPVIRLNGNTIVQIPEKPHETSVYDWALKEWVTDPGLVKQGLRQEMSQAIQTGFTWTNGYTFQLNDKSLTLASGRALKLTRQQLRDELPETVIWRAIDNTNVVFDSEDFLLFVESMEAYYESLLFNYWEQVDTLLN